jgi:hypothetical protein
MQLKNRFIANAGITNVLVIISAKAASMPMIPSAVWVRCMVIESYTIEAAYR